MPLKKEVIYPVFMECVAYCEDVFWENIFKDLSRGKTPSGAYITKDFLCCSYKGREFTYKICRKDVKEVYDEVYYLLTEKLNVLSQKEKQKKKILFQEVEKNLKQGKQEWGTIRKKSIKDIMYEKYVLDMKDMYSLTMKQAKYLLSLILLLITFKTISMKDIIYDGNKISRIEGIDFDQGEIILKRPLCSAKDLRDFSSRSEAESEYRIERNDSECEIEHKEKKMYPLWEKFLKNLKKKINFLDVDSSIENTELCQDQ